MTEIDELKEANYQLQAEVFHMRKHMQAARTAMFKMLEYLGDGRVGAAHDALKSWAAQAQAIDGTRGQG